MNKEQVSKVAELTDQVSKNLIHPKCEHTGKCQETEGFKGTEHEGLSVCDDGCVWHNPRQSAFSAVEAYLLDLGAEKLCADYKPE